MLLAVVSDVRLVLVRLALQLRAHAAPEGRDRRSEQQRAALETREIYAPLANRLGIWQLKWELEDLAFRFSEPDDYQRIAGWLRAKRADRERYIDDVKRELRRELAAAGIEGEVTGRPKHIYSIWRKMQRKGLRLRAGLRRARRARHRRHRRRLLCRARRRARPVAVHPGEFDDYIATPKDNHYRSIHTAVIGPGRLPLEVQIRTHEMHEHAELGVAAHWRYKEGGKAEAGYEQKINWLRQLLEPAASATAPSRTCSTACRPSCSRTASTR